MKENTYLTTLFVLYNIYTGNSSKNMQVFCTGQQTLEWCVTSFTEVYTDMPLEWIPFTTLQTYAWYDYHLAGHFFLIFNRVKIKINKWVMRKFRLRLFCDVNYGLNRGWETCEHSTELMINDSVYGSTFLFAKNGVDGSISGTVVAQVSKGDTE